MIRLSTVPLFYFSPVFSAHRPFPILPVLYICSLCCVVRVHRGTIPNRDQKHSDGNCQYWRQSRSADITLPIWHRKYRNTQPSINYIVYHYIHQRNGLCYRTEFRFQTDDKVGKMLPLITYAVLSITVGLCSLKLPETNKRKLMETVGEIELK